MGRVVEVHRTAIVQIKKVSSLWAEHDLDKDRRRGHPTLVGSQNGRKEIAARMEKSKRTQEQMNDFHSEGSLGFQTPHNSAKRSNQ